MKILADGVDRRRVLVRSLFVSLGVLVVVWIAARLQPDLLTRERLTAFVESLGPLGPLAFVVLQAAQVVFAPIPGQAVAVVAGYVFGWPGLLFSMIGVTLGSVVAFLLSRRFGRPYVERVLDPELLAKLDAQITGAGEIGLLLVFLVPGLPDDVVCFLAGLTPIRFRRFVVLLVVGRTPAYVLAIAIGASLSRSDLVHASLLFALFVLVSALGYRYRERIVRWAASVSAGRHL